MPYYIQKLVRTSPCSTPATVRAAIPRRDCSTSAQRRAGSVFLVALATASLTATIGITSSTASLWEKILGGRLSYRTICLLTCVIACAVSLSGIDAIVSLLSPVIDACYPATIALALYYALGRAPYSRRGLRALSWAMITATAFGVIGSLHSWAKMLKLDFPAFEAFYAALPLSAWTMSWLPFTALAFVCGLACGAKATDAHAGE